MPPANKHQILASNEWYPRPELAYAGVTRNREPRALSLSLALDKYQQASPHFHMKPPIFWCLKDQAMAVDSGFFLARMIDRMERVSIMPLYLPVAPNFAELVLSELEHRAFKDGFLPDKDQGFHEFCTHALEFIEQQDLYGYTGAWDASVMRFTHDLTWYKLLNKPKTLMDMSKTQIRAIHDIEPERFKRLLHSSQASDLKKVLYPMRDWDAALKRHLPIFPKAQTDVYARDTGEVIQRKGERHPEAYFEGGSSERVVKPVSKEASNKSLQQTQALPNARQVQQEAYERRLEREEAARVQQTRARYQAREQEIKARGRKLFDNLDDG